MTDFAIHNPETAPAGSKPLLEKSQKAYGMIPNLHGVMAESPAMLEAYQTLGEIFGRTSLSAVEQNIVWLTSNYENNCHYCMPAHTAIAHMAKVPDEYIEALRTGAPLSDPKLQALREFARQAIVNRGWVEEAEVQKVLDAGYGREQILDVLVGVAHKVLSNYTNHLAQTPVDQPFQKFAWEKPAEAAAE